MLLRYGNPISPKLEIPSVVHPTWGIRGEDCNSVCDRTNQRCDAALSRSIDRCVLFWYFDHLFQSMTGRLFSTMAAAKYLKV